MRALRALWPVVVLSLACFAPVAAKNARTYSMPLTAAEAPLTYPAIASTAEGMGYRADVTERGVAVTDGQGNVFWWGVVGERFSLEITAATTETTPAEEHALRQRADQMWGLAIEARQKSNVGATVVINPVPPPAEHRAVPVHHARHERSRLHLRPRRPRPTPQWPGRRRLSARLTLTAVEPSPAAPATASAKETCACRAGAAARSPATVAQA